MSEQEQVNIYVDDATGDEYIFNGKKLIKISSSKDKPMIGDKPDLDKEDQEREKQAKKEREEDNEQEETEEERKKRLDRIKQFLDDDQVGDQIKYDSEKKVSDEKKRKQAAQKKELEKNLTGAQKNNRVIKLLAKDLGQFLAKEVGKSQRTTSWKKYNGNYDGSGIVRPGNRYEKVGRVPVIQLYLDQSGSWNDNDIKIANDIVNSIADFQRKNLIKIQVYYFSDNIHNNAEDARAEGGTSAGQAILNQLNEQKPENVIIITDGDFDYYGLSSEYTAPGGVWLVFRENRSKDLIKSLHGKLQTKYYDIDAI